MDILQLNMTYRLILQEIKGKQYKHVKQYTLDSIEDIEQLETLIGYIQYCRRKAEEWNEQQQKKRNKKFFESDLFDKKSVGKDISNEEFLENEKFFSTYY